MPYTSINSLYVDGQYASSLYLGSELVLAFTQPAEPVPTYNLYFWDSDTNEILNNVDEGRARLQLVLDTTNVPFNTEIPFTVSGVSSTDIIPDILTGSITANWYNGGQGVYDFSISEDLLTEGLETIVVTLDGIIPTVSATLVINDTSTTPVPTYAAYFLDGNTSIPITELNEGSAAGSIYFRVDTTNHPANLPISYTITGISQEDIDVPLTGVLEQTMDYFWLGNFTIFADNLTEGPETMAITLDGITPTVSAALVINDTSIAPILTYNLYFTDPAGDIVTQAYEDPNGQSTLWSIKLETNAPNNTQIPFTVTGVAANDLDGGYGPFSSGVLTVNEGIGQLYFHVIQDFLTEGTETMVVTLDGITPTVSAALLINDTSINADFNAQLGVGNHPFQVIENVRRGTSCTYSVYVTGEYDYGLQYTYNISGISESEVDVPLTGPMPIINNHWQLDLHFPSMETSVSKSASIQFLGGSRVINTTNFTLLPIIAPSSAFWYDLSDVQTTFTSFPENEQGVTWSQQGSVLSVEPKSQLLNFNAATPAWGPNTKGYIDARGCISLESIYAIWSEIVGLNISGCSNLQYVNCTINCLTELDLQDCTKLISLNLTHSAYLKSLDISSLDLLQTLELQNSYNLFTLTGVANAVSLERLVIGGTKIQELDVSGLTSLSFLHCAGCSLGGNLTGISSFSAADKRNFIIISYCNMSAANLNTIFDQLPTKQPSFTNEWQIFINGNPGTNLATTSIATNKGWIISQ
jgi:hypothetical protein